MSHPRRRPGTSVLLVLAAGLGCRVEHEQLEAGEIEARASTAPSVDIRRADSVLRADMSDPREWQDYGRDYTNQRWSTLTQINTGTVAQLRLAWVNHSGIPHASETNSIVVEGVLYFTTALNHVLALDARTGAEKREYAHDYRGRTVVDCCSSNNKRVALYGGRVFMATVDARLVALDARNGKLLWDAQVGDNEQGIT